MIMYNMLISILSKTYDNSLEKVSILKREIYDFKCKK